MEKNKDEILAWLMSGLFGVLGGAFLIFGYQLETGDAINLSDKNAMLLLLMFIAVFTLDTRYVWRNYDSARRGGKLFGLIKLPAPSTDNIAGKRDFAVTYISLIALSIPVMIAEFPKFFV
jgi:hypothetical protein